MIRNSVVLPEPEGPSSARSSPLPTFKSTLSSAVNAPNFFTIFLTSIVTWNLPFVQPPFEHGLHQQRHRVGLAADVTRDHRHRAKLAHGAGVAQQYAIKQPPLDIGQSDAEE